MRLSTDELTQVLKEQLDDRTAKIVDTPLLLHGILDPLLLESPEYANLYRTKARRPVLHIYGDVQLRRSKMTIIPKVPTGFYEGEQGLLNLGIILRSIITQQGWVIDRDIFQKFSARWVQQQGNLGNLLS